MSPSSHSPPSAAPHLSLTLPPKSSTSASNGRSRITTPDGTLLVQRYRSSSDAKLRSLVSFIPRASNLDRDSKEDQPYRGIYSLFWICLALLFARSTLQSWRETRTLLSLTFGRLIGKDALALALSDMVMVGCMFGVMPFTFALKKGYIKYYWTGAVIQHIFQLCFLGAAVWWGYHRKWFWTQAGFLVLHALSSLMKMHSWCATNGLFSDVYFKMKREESRLAKLLDEAPNGGEGIRKEASERQAEAEERARLDASAKRRTSDETSGTATPVGTPLVPLGATVISTGYISASDNLRHGLLSNRTSGRVTRNTSSFNGSGSSSTIPTDLSPPRKEAKKPSDMSVIPDPTSLDNPRTTPEPELGPHHARARHTTLTFSSDQQVATLAQNIDVMRAEITGTGPEGLMWPDNVTYARYWDFMLLPTLVYELEYPRTPIQRPIYILEKVFATFGVFSLIYIITEYYCFPFMPKPGDSLLDTYVTLALPMIVNYLLIFYIIFECVCNAFAEMTHFADREFYRDWWNSTDMEVYSRKWNKPVHTFLLRHVYAAAISTFGCSRFTAQFVTFLLSALCHEMVMVVVTKKIRMYLFLMQMGQLPMIAIAKQPFFRERKTLANVVFWVGLMSGFPLLAILYMLY